MPRLSPQLQGRNVPLLPELSPILWIINKDEVKMEEGGRDILLAQMRKHFFGKKKTCSSSWALLTSIEGIFIHGWWDRRSCPRFCLVSAVHCSGRLSAPPTWTHIGSSQISKDCLYMLVFRGLLWSLDSYPEPFFICHQDLSGFVTFISD